VVTTVASTGARPVTVFHLMNDHQENDPMARFTVTHNEAIWEATTFEVEVPEPLPEHYNDPRDFIIENLDDLLSAAVDENRAAIEQGDRVVSLDADLEIRDQLGNMVYTDVDDEKDERTRSRTATSRTLRARLS
jgi:hypothetical protein